MAVTVYEIFFLFATVEECLGWLPCLELLGTRRNGLHPLTLARLRRTLQNAIPHTERLPAHMTFRGMVRRLWALTVRPLLQCRKAPTEEWGWVTEVDVAIRYATGRAWRSSSGRRLERDRLTVALFDLRCYRVWQLLEYYGGHFWFDQDTTTGHRCAELHCIVADGFEVFFCRTSRERRHPA